MSGTPITADVAASFGEVATRLTERARILAEAHTAARLLETRQDDDRWRLAELVWPLFAKG